MLKLNNYIYDCDSTIFFDNDDDFTMFAIDPTLKAREVIAPDGTVSYACDWDFSWAYKNAIANNKIFVIKDPNSRILKNGDLGYRATTKKINNVEPYFEI